MSKFGASATVHRLPVPDQERGPSRHARRKQERLIWVLRVVGRFGDRYLRVGRSYRRRVRWQALMRIVVRLNRMSFSGSPSGA